MLCAPLTWAYTEALCCRCTVYSPNHARLPFKLKAHHQSRRLGTRNRRNSNSSCRTTLKRRHSRWWPPRNFWMSGTTRSNVLQRSQVLEDVGLIHNPSFQRPNSPAIFHKRMLEHFSNSVLKRRWDRAQESSDVQTLHPSTVLIKVWRDFNLLRGCVSYSRTPGFPLNWLTSPFHLRFLVPNILRWGIFFEHMHSNLATKNESVVRLEDNIPINFIPSWFSTCKSILSGMVETAQF